MNCPFCGKEIRDGYIQSARRIFFLERERTVLFNPHKVERDVPVTGGFFNLSAPARYYDDCRCLFVKTDEEETRSVCLTA